MWERLSPIRTRILLGLPRQNFPYEDLQVEFDLVSVAPAQPVSPSQLPSDRRPIPLIRRSDLVVKRIDYRGEPHYVIKDPVGLQYHRLRPEQYAALERLDGIRSLEDIKHGLSREFPHVRPSLADVQHLVQDLHMKNLVQSDRPGQGVEMLKREKKNKKKKILSSLRNIMYLRLPGWDPEQSLVKLYPYTRWLFNPWVVLTCLVFVASAWLLVLINFDTFQRKLPEFQRFFGWPNLIWMWVTLACAKIIHEFGHGLSCHHFGGECHEMGVMLLVFSPCLYCDVTDSWMIRSKWPRFFIGGAGMYIEVILSAMAIYVWWFTQPGLLNYLALNVFFVTTITTVIFNANPLMRFDGYYMLSDLLEIPNLRQKADGMLRETFAKYCLGIELRPDPFRPESGRGWLMFFSVASFLYRWLIIFGIATFLYTVLKPYGLQSIGATMAVVSLSTFFYSMIAGTVRIFKTPRSEPLNKFRLGFFLFVVTGLVTLALSVPFPWYVESPMYVQPEDVRHIYVTTPGQLDDIRVKPGETVKTGDTLAILQNPELSDRLKELESEYHLWTARLKTAIETNDAAGEIEAEERQVSLEKEIRELRRQVAELTIVAQIDGRIVPPPRKPMPKRDPSDPRLPPWHGTPLDQQNDKVWLDAQTHLFSIAPKDTMEAVLVVDQGQREDIAVDLPVQFRLDHLPGQVFDGKISMISHRHLENAPPSLSNKYGGPLPTVSGQNGEEQLTSIAYEATVQLAEQTESLRAGTRGEARVLVERRTAADWLWRWIRKTFYFRL